MVRDWARRLDELSEDNQSLNEVGDEGRELEDIGASLQSLEDVKNRGEGLRNSARTSRALRRSNGNKDLGTRGRNTKANTKRAPLGNSKTLKENSKKLEGNSNMTQNSGLLLLMRQSGPAGEFSVNRGFF